MWLRSPASTFRGRLCQRERSAYLIKEDLSLQRELKRNLAMASTAVVLAKDDEVIYERLFHGQAPPELREVLQDELLLWITVRDYLNNFTQRDMLPDQYRQETNRLRPFLDDLSLLAALAITAFQRPLTHHEQNELAAIRERTN